MEVSPETPAPNAGANAGQHRTRHPHLVCPNCQEPALRKTVDSRPANGGGIRRRRECISCGAQASTIEAVVSLDLRHKNLAVLTGAIAGRFDRRALHPDYPNELVTLLKDQALKQLRAVAPEIECNVIAIAEGQEEYLTIYGGLVRNLGYPAPNGEWNTVLLAFRLDEEHRQAIANGADVYLSLLTFGGSMPPVLMQVGKASAAAVYNLKSLPKGSPQ